MPNSASPPPDQPLLNSCPTCGQHLDVTALEPYSKIVCSACQGTIRVRTSFHHFVIREQIGIGGMSRVFRATDTALKRDVALKILNRQCSNDKRRVDQFEHEARVTAAISHPNVVKVYSAGWDQGYFYIAMELVRGGSLEESIRQEKRLSEARILAVAVETARGLKAAQAAGLIHRDIKPGNILFADDGTAKIVDFGLALMVKAGQNADKELWATPYYVPPEKLEGGTEDHRSDLYSLGATLFHAVLGRPPCATDTNSLEELRALKAVTVKLTTAESALVSSETAALLGRTLEKNPEDRYASYDEFIKHAQFALQHPGKSLPKVKPKPRPMWVMGAAALGILLVGGGVGMWLKKATHASAGEGALQIVSDPTASGNQSISAQFTQARDALFRGELPEAQEAFVSLASNAPQPTSHWATFNAGLCALLRGDEPASRGIFARLQSYGEDSLAQFFGGISPLLSGANPVRVDQVAWLQGESYSAMGWLALGLKNWQQGDWRSAREMLEKFAVARPASAAAWVANYQALIAPHLDDLHQLHDWPTLSLAGLTGAQATERLKIAEVAVGRLRLAGPVKAACAQELAAFSKELQPLLAGEKEADDKKHAELLQQDTAQLRKAVAEASLASKGLNFPAAMVRLEQLEIDTPEIKEQWQDELALWRDAEEFLQQLSKDLGVPGLERELARVDGPIQRGKILSASRDGLHFQVSGVNGDVLITWSQLAPVQLVRLAEAPLEEDRITDSDEYYRRRRLIVAFALKANLPNYGALRGAELAREHRDFSQLWRRLEPHLPGLQP